MFRLTTVPGLTGKDLRPRKYIFTRNGLKTGEAEGSDWWYFAPEFEIPKWIKGAVMYQIYTDRFCFAATRAPTS